jgi:hypothetical protein
MHGHGQRQASGVKLDDPPFLENIRDAPQLSRSNFKTAPSDHFGTPGQRLAGEIALIPAVASTEQRVAEYERAALMPSIPFRDCGRAGGSCEGTPSFKIRKRGSKKWIRANYRQGYRSFYRLREDRASPPAPRSSSEALRIIPER